MYAEVAGEILHAAHSIGMTDGQFVFFTLHAELDLLMGNRHDVDEIFTGKWAMVLLKKNLLLNKKVRSKVFFGRILF